MREERCGIEMRRVGVAGEAVVIMMGKGSRERERKRDKNAWSERKGDESPLKRWTLGKTSHSLLPLTT
jgi:hypothetical protein